MMKQNNTSIASRLLMMAMLLLVHLQTTRAEDIYASYTMKEGTTMYIDAKEHSKVKYYTVTMDYYYKIQYLVHLSHHLLVLFQIVALQ